MADIAEHVQDANIVQYADDVTLIVSAETPEAAQNQMNRALEQFHAYMTTNRLAPEATKHSYSSQQHQKSYITQR